ncbi:LPS assembly lipoprotein LptE [Sphingomonas sp. Mn802worker]|uniref:LPS assembly lipoprotein LptE n=1 Tax=Sphingomonas sp. Mn802worker TaxID=629773 RepID=UPI0003626480|nr:LPS assembly lipoprotein LptE [Sphingomonas sp. Mn802worker]
MMRLAPLTVLMSTMLLGGCGLQPLYSGGSNGPVSRAIGQVSVDPIEGKAGWLMTNALNDRLGAVSGGGAPYRLVVKLDDQIRGLGVRRDNSVTRERRTLRARYQLIDSAQGTVVLDQTAGSDVGIDVVQSDYAVVAAENTALERLSVMLADQIVARLALYARRRAQPQP